MALITQSHLSDILNQILPTISRESSERIGTELKFELYEDEVQGAELEALRPGIDIDFDPWAEMQMWAFPEHPHIRLLLRCNGSLQAFATGYLSSRNDIVLFRLSKRKIGAAPELSREVARCFLECFIGIGHVVNKLQAGSKGQFKNLVLDAPQPRLRKIFDGELRYEPEYADTGSSAYIVPLMLFP